MGSKQRMRYERTGVYGGRRWRPVTKKWLDGAPNEMMGRRPSPKTLDFSPKKTLACEKAARVRGLSTRLLTDTRPGHVVLSLQFTISTSLFSSSRFSPHTYRLRTREVHNHARSESLLSRSPATVRRIPLPARHFVVVFRLDRLPYVWKSRR